MKKSLPRVKRLVILCLVVLFINTECFSQDGSYLSIPPDNTISSMCVADFVLKSTIILQAKKISVDELNQIVRSIKRQGDFKIARELYIDSLQNTEEYYVQIEKSIRNQMLQGLDKITLNNRIHDYVLVVQLKQLDDYLKVIGNIFGLKSRAEFYTETKRLEQLEYVVEDLISGKIGIEEVYKRAVNNSFFDDANMGDENFVRACFQLLLDRYYTEYEKQQSLKMLKGEEVELLFSKASGKEGFLRILLQSDEFYENLTAQLYESHLHRQPNVAELIHGIRTLRLNGLKTLQKEILCKDELIRKCAS